MQAWENGIGKGSTRIRRKNFQTRTYQIGPIGNGVTSVRITGNRCKIQFKDNMNNEKCVLEAGDYTFPHEFPTNFRCDNDEITQYTVNEGPLGIILM